MILKINVMKSKLRNFKENMVGARKWKLTGKKMEDVENYNYVKGRWRNRRYKL